jgi:alginate O-acetyltransferase complex protein AlgI
MLFNSLQFLFFFVVVTLLYYSVSWRGRWILLLLASCYFYMVFKPIYILILAVTIVVDYFAGIWLEKTTGQTQKWLLIVSLISNIGFLAYYKYAGFFIENINRLLPPSLDIPFVSDVILPIGLSFHTFQAMSYTIEVYRGNQKAERHFGIYALYVMFYPQLVAGPIERPQNVLWQFHEHFPYKWKNIKEGLVRMAWGMFKKVVIADRLTMIVDASYDTPHQHNGLTLLVATLAFTFQIYCDFSGYSDIALGAARVMGFELMENFRTPYLATSISEFWKRWHISLSTWFRDYLYIPLGGNRVAAWRNSLNLLIVFMVSGLWHGDKWTYVVWGGLHGTYLVMAQWRDSLFENLKTVRRAMKRFENGSPCDLKMIIKKSKSSTSQILKLLHTFILVMLTWVFFRAKGMSYAFTILKKISQISIHDVLVTPLNSVEMWFCVGLVILLMIKERYLYKIPTHSNFQFVAWFVSLIILSYLFGVFNSSQFIYFQF